MSFDKEAYWAKRGQKTTKTRAVTRMGCARCRSTNGTLVGNQFYCNTPNCKKKPEDLAKDGITKALSPAKPA